jgi:hypothetical protein
MIGHTSTSGICQRSNPNLLLFFAVGVVSAFSVALLHRRCRSRRPPTPSHEGHRDRRARCFYRLHCVIGDHRQRQGRVLRSHGERQPSSELQPSSLPRCRSAQPHMSCSSTPINVRLLILGVPTALVVAKISTRHVRLTPTSNGGSLRRPVLFSACGIFSTMDSSLIAKDAGQMTHYKIATMDSDPKGFEPRFAPCGVSSTRCPRMAVHTRQRAGRDDPEIVVMHAR